MLDEAEIVPGNFVAGILLQDLQIKLTRDAILPAAVEFHRALKERGIRRNSEMAAGASRSWSNSSAASARPAAAGRRS